MNSRKPGTESFSRADLDELHRRAESVINANASDMEATPTMYSTSNTANAKDGSAFLYSSDEKYDTKEVQARVKADAGNYVANTYQNRNPDGPVRTSTTVERFDGEEQVTTEIKDPRAVKLVASLAARQLSRKAEHPDNP